MYMIVGGLSVCMGVFVGVLIKLQCEDITFKAESMVIRMQVSKF